MFSELQKPEKILETVKPVELLNYLKSLNIDYRLYNHSAVFTVAEAHKIEQDMPGIHCRNLFLRDKKNFFLVVAANNTRIDLKKLRVLIGSSPLSFGNADQLRELLGVEPGSVCPYSVINDKDSKVTLLLDAMMMQGKIINHHPLINTMTIGVTPADLNKFFESLGRKAETIDLRDAAPHPELHKNEIK